MDQNQSDIRSTFLNQFHHATFASTKPADWRLVCDYASDLPPSYLMTFMEYFRDYFDAQGQKTEDFSVIFYHNDRPMGIWPVQVVLKPTGERSLISVDTPVTGPIFLDGMPGKTQKDIAKLCVQAARLLCRAYSLPTFQSTEVISQGISQWQRILNGMAKSNSVSFECCVNLTPKLEIIRAALRKSYKSCINDAAKSWTSTIHINSGETEFREFQNLHREVAGRETRPKSTWDAQKDALLSGEAFLITLRDQTQRLVGAGYFMLSRTNARYATAVYDRSLFDKPLAHLVVWEAIKFSQSKGCLRLYLGEQGTRFLTPEFSEKEFSVREFREGFSTEFLARINSTLLVDHEAPETPL